MIDAIPDDMSLSSDPDIGRFKAPERPMETVQLFESVVRNAYSRRTIGWRVLQYSRRVVCSRAKAPHSSSRGAETDRKRATRSELHPAT
jgi:hypothetical protein